MPAVRRPGDGEDPRRRGATPVSPLNEPDDITVAEKFTPSAGISLSRNDSANNGLFRKNHYTITFNNGANCISSTDGWVFTSSNKGTLIIANKGTVKQPHRIDTKSATVRFVREQ